MAELVEVRYTFNVILKFIKGINVQLYNIRHYAESPFQVSFTLTGNICKPGQLKPPQQLGPQ